MDRAESGSVLFEKKTGRRAYVRKEELSNYSQDGLFTRGFVNTILSYYDDLASKQVTNKDIVDSQMYQVQMASMLGDLKKELTGQDVEINLK